MSQVTGEMVKQLRACTGVGMSKCKEALLETGGDMQKAIDYLRKKGMASAEKKEGREAKEGMVYVLETSEAIALLEANCETDFVAKNEKFQAFVNDLCEQILENKPESLESFIDEIYQKDLSLTIDQYRNLVIQALGENIQIKRIKWFHKKKNSSYGIYSHMGGKIVAIVEIQGAEAEQELARDLAMQVAAENPEYLSPEEVPASVREREEEIARFQIQGKPEAIAQKIIAGKFQAYCDQFCLICQKFIKDNSLTVMQVLKNRSKEIGKELSIPTFFRWGVGS